MIVYWDTSALVAIYIEDACSRLARGVFQKAEHAISSWLCFAETHAALRAAKETGRISQGEYLSSVKDFEDDWVQFRRMPVRETIAAELRRIFKHHAIRGADATHLATALVAQRHLGAAGDGFVFACHDLALARAAEAEQLHLAWDI
jgi:predicted nucleic acid-binding protein